MSDRVRERPCSIDALRFTDVRPAVLRVLGRFLEENAA